jgi:ABC-type Zn uptake system ZnuABC Zn-binding protein ZnuA
MSYRRRATRLVIAALAVAAAAGCGGTDDAGPSLAGDDRQGVDDEGTTPAGPDAADAVATTGPQLRIVSTVAPIADVVQQVLGDRGEVHHLVPVGMDSHSYEPRPSDVVPLGGADAFIDNGLDLNPAAVELAEANLPDGAPLVLLGEEALDPDALSDEHWHADDGHTHSHDDGDTHHTHDGDEPHDGAGGVNPHVWTSVKNVLAYVDVIEATLTDLDPDGAEGYAKRADAYRDELTALDEAIQAAVDSLDEGRRKLVVYHDAWAYFGRRYGVEVVAAVQPSAHAEPSASDVRAIIDQIREEDVPAVFGAEEFPTSVAATIADETGATYVGELADDTLPGEPGDPDHSYVGMMVENVRRIVESLGGDATPLDALTRG